MWGFLANTSDWDIISIPPTMTAAKQVTPVTGSLLQTVWWANLHRVRTALHTDAGPQGLKLLRDLKCQLSGGGEDEGVEPLGGG